MGTFLVTPTQDLACLKGSQGAKGGGHKKKKKKNKQLYVL